MLLLFAMSFCCIFLYREFIKEPKLILKFGIYWDKELNPYCPVCKTPLTLISDSRPNCYKCDKIIPIVSSDKRIGLAEA